MCIFARHRYMCGGSKIKIWNRCKRASYNSQGILFCPLDPHPHIADGKKREFIDGRDVHGPGICGNMNCRARFGIPEENNVDDDSEYDMSEGACQERERRWIYDVLSEDQRVEFLKVRYSIPVPYVCCSTYAKFWIYAEVSKWSDWVKMLPKATSEGPDSMKWQELNPRHMSAGEIAWATYVGYLPARVTDIRPDHRRQAATQREAWVGPFKNPCMRCPQGGWCPSCGRWLGEGEASPPTLHGNNYSQSFLKWLTSPNCPRRKTVDMMLQCLPGTSLSQLVMHNDWVCNNYELDRMSKLILSDDEDAARAMFPEIKMLFERTPLHIEVENELAEEYLNKFFDTDVNMDSEDFKRDFEDFKRFLIARHTA